MPDPTYEVRNLLVAAVQAAVQPFGLPVYAVPPEDAELPFVSYAIDLKPKLGSFLVVISHDDQDEDPHFAALSAVCDALHKHRFDPASPRMAVQAQWQGTALLDDDGVIRDLGSTYQLVIT